MFAQSFIINLANFMQFHAAKYFGVSVCNIISVSFFMHMTPAFWRAYNWVTDSTETQYFRLRIFRILSNDCHSLPSTMHSPSDGDIWLRETAPRSCAKYSLESFPVAVQPLTALPSSLTASCTD